MSPVVERLKSEIDFICAGSGRPAHWQQESYKGSIFKLFEKHRNETNYDKLRGDVLEAWEKEGVTENLESRKRILREICDAWKEWEYACKKYGVQLGSSAGGREFPRNKKASPRFDRGEASDFKLFSMV